MGNLLTGETAGHLHHGRRAARDLAMLPRNRQIQADAMWIVS
jgi:hypothetical protein